MFSIFVYSSKLVDIQKLVDSLRGYLEMVFFQWFFEKRLKMAEKSVLTSFGVCAAPKSWSKCTTTVFTFGVTNMASCNLKTWACDTVFEWPFQSQRHTGIVSTIWIPYLSWFRIVTVFVYSRTLTQLMLCNASPTINFY